MRVQYIEGNYGEIKENSARDFFRYNNLYVRIGEKVKLGTTLCEVVDIVHYPANQEEDYTVDVFVKVIKKLPESWWERPLFSRAKKSE
ncbi:hypothetical protein [Peribacillus frigoritolerans]|uniref:hypothetical protein n=1 Tax=Peribacillus frigoritolerans TaxID=450367 RepID=UPI0007BFECA8|nr:hypothetical protein [Peribacillus frigoritolerans]MDM5309873.1 hypothetical protein [Peribacillus frigoritolerans]